LELCWCHVAVVSMTAAINCIYPFGTSSFHGCSIKYLQS
jgi:hypothetical protein